MPVVSVIVPVYDPGRHIDRCIESLLDQTLPADDYEAIFVDDGSTDGTAERLDALAAAHPHVRVEHIPNSGWPGRPRNVGLDLARGEFVYFVDNDDWIERDALERLCATAAADRADIVVGKVVGHGRYVAAPLFRRTLHAVSLRDTPALLGLLSPHKLFRRALLDEHGIRFPEGRVRFEDHAFVLRAYFAAERISVLADAPVYHWVRHGDANASSAWDPELYYRSLRDVLDVVCAHVPEGPERDRYLLRWYRSKVLGRLAGPRAATHRPQAWRRRAFEEARAVVAERFHERLDARLAFNERARAALLRRGDFEGLAALAALERGLRAEAVLEGIDRGDGAATLRIAARFAPGQPGLAFAREGAAVRWVAPGEAARLPPEALDATEALGAVGVEVALRALEGHAVYGLPVEARRRVEEDGGRLRPAATALARLDPATAAGGGRLPAGDYELVVALRAAGFRGEGVAARAHGLPPVAVRVGPGGEVDVVALSARAARLALARRLPRVARAAARARRAVGRR